jgi:ABC-type iron transport system FetAB ATPase subunit
LKVGSKKAEEILKRKLAYVKPKFWSFGGQIETNLIFPLNFEKYLKIEKFPDFAKKIYLIKCPLFMVELITSISLDHDNNKIN